MNTIRWATLLATTACAGFAAVSVAAEFKSHAARSASDQYTAIVAKLDAEYQQKLNLAANDYLTQLATAKDVETKAGNLDAAIEIRDAMEKLKPQSVPVVRKSGPALERQKLAKALAGTTWKTGSKRLKFNEDGTASLGDGPVWEWAAIDGRAVYIMKPDGWTNRLNFDPALTTFSDQEFGNGTRRDGESGSIVPR